MAKYIVYSTAEEKEELLQLLIKYNVEWVNGRKVSFTGSPSLYPSPGYVSFCKNEAPDLIGAIRRGDDIEWARDYHGKQNEYHLFNPGRISDYLFKSNIVTEDIFVKMIAGDL